MGIGDKPRPAYIANSNQSLIASGCHCLRVHDEVVVRKMTCRTTRSVVGPQLVSRSRKRITHRLHKSRYTLLYNGSLRCLIPAGRNQIDFMPGTGQGNVEEPSLISKLRLGACSIIRKPAFLQSHHHDSIKLKSLS